jgi:hypothetical protein
VVLEQQVKGMLVVQETLEAVIFLLRLVVVELAQ